MVTRAVRLKEVMKLLESTEEDIMSWLHEVVDFRYPLGMYKGTVSYFDSHINTLVTYLKEQDLYDQSLIIVTAPHGEMLENSTIPYHHFLLTPDTLHVPLIIKPPKQNDTRSGTRISGTFDLIDLFPTILDIQGLPHGFKLSGVSRWDLIRRGQEIPPHDSFAAGMHQLAHSVFRSPYLFARTRTGIEMQTFHGLASGAPEVFYDTRSGETHISDFPPVVGDLRESLDAWLGKPSPADVDGAFGK